ncbi:MAG TPA: hypothetical protein VMR62_18430 [Bryobacteraceae bacterium]|jgi:hypothetical protein|nr:hypothetical protein [Bryobacteraceae bacterium]
MSNTKTSPVLRFLPSMTDFAFLMPLIFIFEGMRGAKTLLGDGDTGWHVRTGEWILSHGRVPHTDLFSYTKTGQPWFAWEWLWDVIFAWLHQHWGMAAVVVASALVISLTSALVFRLAFRKSGNPLIAMALTFLAVASSSIHFLARPHLFTLLFTAVFYTITERVREQVRENQSARLLWCLPVLTVLWTNLHGGWFIGIVLLGLYGAGELANGLCDGRPGAWVPAIRRMLPYEVCALACLAASLIGPYTYHLHVHIWSYLTDSFQREHIQEMLPISFQNPAARYFEILLLVGGGACLWHLRRMRFTECLLLVFFAHIGLIASRNIPIFGIVAAPVLALAVTEWFKMLEDAPVSQWLRNLAKGLAGMGESLGSLEGAWRTHLLSAAAVALVTAILYAPAPPANFRARFDAKEFPAKALASLGGSAAHSRIFTSDQWGDFLIYNLYPQSQVFIDGRSDFYGSKFVDQYLEIVNVKYNWQQHLNKYGVDTVLLPTDAPLAGALKESSRWHVVYDDGDAIVFRTAARTGGSPVSAADLGGKDRDREITSKQPSDRTITKTKT